MWGQVHRYEDCSWWHYISSNSERHFWRKIRTKGEREKEEGKGKGKLTTVPSREEKCWGPQVSLLPWVPFPAQQRSLRHTFPIATVCFSLASPQTPYRLFLLTVLLALIGKHFDQGRCCMAGWFLSSYMHVIRSPNINQKLQARSRKKGEKEGWISHQRQLLPMSTCRNSNVFAGVTS